MNIKVLRDFVAFGVTYPAGKTAELPDDVADRAIKAGWADSDESEWPKHVGGGYYELSNGEKVKGKEAAFEAQALIGNDEE